MVIVYTEDTLESIFDDPDFLLDYDKYKETNKVNIDNLQKFLDSFKTNKNYHKISINKNKKYQSLETTKIKNINNLLNKCTIDNIDNIKKEILDDIKNTIHISNLVVESILKKCILQPNYIDLYIQILKDIIKVKNYDIQQNLDNTKTLIYKEDNEDKEDKEDNEDKEDKEVDYHTLCELNENIDKSIALSILIVKLEYNNLIEDQIDDTIIRMFENIVIDNEDICYKYIISLYNIFELLDVSYIEKYKDKLIKLKNERISKKNKFKIMDVLEKV